MDPPISYRPSRRVDEAEITALVGRASERDGAPALSEHKAIRLPGAPDAEAIVGVRDDFVVAYGQAAWHPATDPESRGHWAVELVFDDVSAQPTELDRCVRALEGLISSGELRLWAGTSSLAVAAAAAGYQEMRRLLRLRRPRATERVEAGDVNGVRLAPFVEAADASEWLLVNNAAFAGHPENGALTTADLKERLAQAWFDPAGFLIARDASRMVGFCWTKVHDDGVGEIYIIAVHPEASGRGLGRLLVSRGLDYLYEVRDVPTVMLYTEGDNTKGIRLYRGTGFELDHTLYQFVVPRTQPNL